MPRITASGARRVTGSAEPGRSRRSTSQVPGAGNAEPLCVGPERPRRGKDLLGYWAVPFVRAAVQHPTPRASRGRSERVAGTGVARRAGRSEQAQESPPLRCRALDRESSRLVSGAPGPVHGRPAVWVPRRIARAGREQRSDPAIVSSTRSSRLMAPAKGASSDSVSPMKSFASTAERSKQRLDPSAEPGSRCVSRFRVWTRRADRSANVDRSLYLTSTPWRERAS